ncbi:radical SAM/SPASM domain-containing protein [Ferrovibrio sp.]|uniref:radical SAM/SPASM domain-containing protein n=1 Tax=Ferrovibrio sp. TaxID=1917215 RepID=UPI002627AE27|nr:radical SAM/SPASM domain-containing protein [Ferrovibrio sp.]
MIALNAKQKKFIKQSAPFLLGRYRDWKMASQYGDDFWNTRISKVVRLVDDLENNPYDKIRPRDYNAYPKQSRHAIIEINNTCNLNCAMCQTMSATRKRGRMEIDLFKETLEKLVSDGINNVALHTLGDPLANPRLPEIFAELRRYGVTTSICTNGLLLDRHVDTLLEYMDICPSIAFSVDGATKETYERIRIGGKFETLLEQLEISNQRLRPKGMTVKIHCTLSKDNLHEVGLFIETFRKYVPYPALDISFGVITGLAPDNTYFESVNPFPNHTHRNLMCWRPKGDPLWVNIDGTVSACCRDYHGELIIGNIKDSTYRELQESEGLHALQKAHESGDLSAYPPCDTCFRPDKRLDEIVNAVLQHAVYMAPDESRDFYQSVADDMVSILRSNGNYAEKIEELTKRAA